MTRRPSGLLYVAPALIVTGLLFHLPIVRLFLLSFGVDDISLSHYEELFATQLYTDALARTIRISLTVTFFSLIIGYPIAYVLASARRNVRTLVALAVLIPFWSSILVRTYAWIYILARQGSVNDVLLSLGIVDTPIRFMFNEIGVIVGMTNALLPFVVLPIYVSLQAQNKSLLEAAHSLGASRTCSFLTITLPLSRPGMYAGALLVFAMALGFFVTPALLGGGKVLMAATYISREIENFVNWPLAAAASVILLLVVSVIISAYARFVSVGRLSALGGFDA